MLPPLHLYLAKALPPSVRLLVHHVVSEKYASPALFPAPPGEVLEPTTAESHLLSLSIRQHGKALHVFALEVYVYETSSLTTIFVSKADSTGYLHLLSLPSSTPSPIKAVTTAFLDWLVKKKRRTGIRLLLSLFARAQNQYLFPGSIENNGKHILDDRQLIRWWCRVLDPILLRYGKSDVQQPQSAHAHLIVPGLDPYETRSYLPKAVLPESDGKRRWSATDPLPELGKSSGLPPRCYIPRFPDDPKARFVIDLDDELPSDPEPETGPERGKSPGIWKSVKSLPEFWELMAFRQECSAGRLVGFIWLVFEATHADDDSHKVAKQGDASGSISQPLSDALQPQQSQVTQMRAPADTKPTMVSSLQVAQQQQTDSSDLVNSQVQVASIGQSANLEELSPASQHLNSPNQQDSLPELQIKRSVYETILLELDRLDYANLDIAFDSTEKFLKSLLQMTDLKQDWGKEIIGTQISVIPDIATPASKPTGSMDSGGTVPVATVAALSVKRKKQSVDETPALSAESKTPAVNVLSSTTVRKRPKV